MEMTRSEAPCQGCSDRHVGCHNDDCLKWSKFQQEASRIYEARLAAAGANAHRFEFKNKYRKKAKK